jgi:hypothetical protein
VLKCIRSMPKRCAEVIRNHGGSIDYWRFIHSCITSIFIQIFFLCPLKNSCYPCQQNISSVEKILLSNHVRYQTVYIFSSFNFISSLVYYSNYLMIAVFQLEKYLL